MGTEAEPADVREHAGEHADPSEDGDTTILRALFGGSGLHSALDHSAIETANDPVKINAEREASQLAERAAKALRESRREVRSRPVHLYVACAPCQPFHAFCILFYHRPGLCL
jgi:DNA excision repair protein ERCC-6